MSRADEGRRVARGGRGGRRPAPAARRRHRRLAVGRVGRGHRHRPRLPGGGLDAPDRADHADRARVVLHPARRLSARAGALPADPGRVRDRRGPQRLPAGQHRHLRDAADVHGDRRGRELRRRARRDARAEDLLHAGRRVRLRVPVRLGSRHVRAPAQAAARPPGPHARRARRRRDARSSSSRGSSAASCASSSRRPSRAERSSRGRASTSCASRCPRSAPGWRSSA